jgi:hypothetical protein
MDRATDGPEPPAKPVDGIQANDHDDFAEAYAVENEGSIQNAHYEWPAMPALAADVTGGPCSDLAAG